MKSLIELRDEILNGSYDKRLGELYKNEDLNLHKNRYAKLLDEYEKIFGNANDISFYSAPGRTEICGNHTDHNHGRVLAASVNLDAVAAVSKRDDNIIKLKSEGYEIDIADISDLSVKDNEIGKSVSLIRGICCGLKERGYKIGGFNATTTSNVISGSGVSSSAAFEVLVGNIINYLYNNGKIDAVTIAQVGQYAENKFFGKPCGLMDQTACSVGGFVTIDFNDPNAPVIEKIDFDFSSCNHTLCIVNTGGSHADLTDEYASVRKEMENVAGCFGKKVLRDIDENVFRNNISEVRKVTGDRAVLRAIHFFDENKRVENAVNALKSDNFDAFKINVIGSGLSSFMYNQNVYASKNNKEQSVSLALALSQEILGTKGAYRVHGGGFAGTIQAFVPNELLKDYIEKIENVFGKGNCYVLTIRPFGGIKVF